MRAITPILLLLAAGCTTPAPSVNVVAPQENKQLADIYEKRRQDLEQETNRKRQRIDELGTAMKRELIDLMACQDKYAQGVALITSETPDTIVLATFSACAHLESPLRKLENEMHAIGGDPTGADRAMARFREAHRERLTRKIIETRSAMRPVAQ
jgi:hypothetical protein